jgi:WD domain, G-beta repeat
MHRLVIPCLLCSLSPCLPVFGSDSTVAEFKHVAPLSAVAISPDGKLLASAGWEKTLQTVRIWDVATGKELHACTGHEAEIECLAFSPDGKFLASGAWDKTVRLWDAQTGKAVRQIGTHPDGILCLAFSPDGKLLATGNQDRMAQQGTLHLWEVSTGKAVRTIAGHALPVTALAFSADGRRLATGSVDKTVRLFEVDSGKELGRFEGHENWVQAVAFAPDGRSLASAGADKLVRLWDIAAGKQRYLFEGHTDKVRTLAYAVDGRTLVSGGFDRTIRFWETATGKERLRFAGHKAGVRSLVYAPDGRHLASGGTDGVVRLLDIVALIHEGKPPKETLEAKELDTLWSDLASADVPRSYRALGALAGAARPAVPFLQEKLGPAISADEKRLAALIADLDGDRFVVRERASQALHNLGDLAVPALQAALQGERSVEARRRVEEILQRLQGPVTSPERMRPLRAVEALEQIGTPPAQKVLEALAKGAPEAWLTREAKASLERLGKRPAALGRSE